jgi:hypothetical protein
LGVHLAVQVFAAQTRLWARVLALVNVYIFILLIVGNVDGLILLGVALSWRALQRHHPWRLGLGLWILSLKPQSVVLTILVILWGVRFWTWPERWRAIGPVFISVVSSPLIFGWDWPVRYWANLQAAPPWPPLVTTIWRALEKLSVPMLVGGLGASCALVALGWVLWRYGATQWGLLVALTTNVLFAIYAIEPHYVLLLPTFLFVSDRLPGVAILAYLIGLGVFSLRAIFGLDYVWLASVYPLILFVAMWFIVRSDLKPFPQRVLQKT